MRWRTGWCGSAQPDAPWWAGLKAAQGFARPAHRRVPPVHIETSLSQKIAEAKAVVPSDAGGTSSFGPPKPASAGAACSGRLSLTPTAPRSGSGRGR